MHAFLRDHPEQRLKPSLSRDRFRIQTERLSVSMRGLCLQAEWTLKQVQGDDL